MAVAEPRVRAAPSSPSGVSLAIPRARCHWVGRGEKQAMWGAHPGSEDWAHPPPRGPEQEATRTGAARTQLSVPDAERRLQAPVRLESGRGDICHHRGAFLLPPDTRIMNGSTVLGRHREQPPTCRPSITVCF